MAKNMIGNLFQQIAALSALTSSRRTMPRRSELSGKSTSMVDEGKTAPLGWAKYRHKNQRGAFGSNRAGKAYLRKMMRYGYEYHGHLSTHRMRQRCAA